MKLVQFMRMLRSVVGMDAVQPTRERYKFITNKIGRRRLRRVRKFHLMNQVTVTKHFGTFRPLKPFNH